MRERFIFDLETDGFLKRLTRIHVMVLHDMDTGEKLVFRHNDEVNSVEEGVKLLMAAKLLVGHNIISFDLKAIKKLYPYFMHNALVRDTLTMVKITATDIAKSDFKLYNAGVIRSDDIGSHRLEVWGYRLGILKGDYAQEMKDKGLDPWASWNQDMEDYCIQDVEVTLALWNIILPYSLPERCVSMEHDVHTITDKMEDEGFPFDLAAAKDLALKLEIEKNELSNIAIAEFGEFHFTPEKVNVCSPLWYDPAGVQQKKEALGQFYKPRQEFGEDNSRKWWGEVSVPKRNYTRHGVKYEKDQPFCKGSFVPFNPGSRPQIVDLLSRKYNWEPTEFTDAGRPSIDDAVLKVAAEKIPVCTALAEYFFVTKLLGQLSAGNKSWIKKYNEETGCIHTHTDTGATVTGRCAHSNPNIGQVPAVISVATMKDEKPNKAFILPNGDWQPHVFNADGTLKKEAPLLGRAGKYGWECRSLFGVPEGWIQIGVDLKGIELRCLAAECAEFDGGELVDVVLHGDPHEYNQQKTGIPTRAIVKRVLYGLLYGAGDTKLGLTADPTLSLYEATVLGRKLRDALMTGLPALRKTIEKIKMRAAAGTLVGLDGRPLKVRSEHSALNTKLQSSAAIIAKKWLTLTYRKAVDAGMRFGWYPETAREARSNCGDFVIMAFVHDELQNAVAPDFVDSYKDICCSAAVEAGEFYDFSCPVAADAKTGFTWAQCH